MFSKKFLLLICLVALLIIPFASAGDDWYVGTNTTIDGDGSADNPFNNMQLALNNANTSDNIYIQSGNYSGDNNTNLIIDKNNISISSIDGEVIFTGDNIFNVNSIGVAISGLSFINCTESIINVNGELNAYNLTFINNTAKQDVCINAERGTTLTVDSCYFDSNNATDSDGAAVTNRGNAYIYNCIFNNNIAYRDGGAIRNYGGIITVVNSSFTNNRAQGKFQDSWGGAIYQWIGTTNIDSCIFINNSATTYGGAILVCKGALDAAWSNFTCVNSVFLNNTAKEGGAITLDGTKGYVNNCSFINNTNYTVYVRDYLFTDEMDLNIDNNWWGVSNPNWNETIIRIDIPQSRIVLNFTTNTTNLKINQTAEISCGFYLNGTNTSWFNPTLNYNISSNGGNLSNMTFSSGVDGIYTITAVADNEKEIILIDVSDEEYFLSSGDVILYYKNGTRFKVILTDVNGTPLYNKTITVEINGVQYEKHTNINGIISIGLNLNTGIYNVTTTYRLTSLNSTVTVLSTVNGSDIVKIYKNATQFRATFLDGQGNLLTGTNVTFNINGVYYTRMTNGYGVARLNINLIPNVYIITSINPVTGEMASNNVTVLSSIVENHNLTKYYRNASRYSARILGYDGNPVGAGESVSFNINGIFYYKTTNDDGYVTLNINLYPGSYIMTTEFNGLRVSNNITVLPILYADDLEKEYGNSTPFKVLLVNGTGVGMANETVSFNINGMFYNRTTNDSGIAKLNINLMPGEYIITSQYNGVSISNNITVIETNESET